MRAGPSPRPGPGRRRALGTSPPPPPRSPRSTSSRPGSNQRSMPSCGLETIAAPDDASSNGRAVDEPATVACGRRVRLRFTRAAEIARAKTLKGMSPMHPRGAGVALEVEPAEREVELGRTTRRLADHDLHPVAPELVAVPVEEDVDLLLDRLRREELRIRSPVQRFRATRAELEQAARPALRVGEHEVVLPRVRAVVRVEAGVHPAVLRQAHRNVAVVEHDRDAVALAQRLRDAAEVRHRDGEHDHGVRLLRLDEPLQMALPARRDPARDRLARELVERGLVRARLGAPEVAIALHAREHVTNRLVRLALAVGRVGRRPPPRGLDRPAPIRRHDEVDARLVHPLPELPPGRRAAVSEVEVDRGRGREDLRRAHQ